ncbi:hypothetical protein CRG98_043706 [Punica granatum]|uniref:Uncharacterized protein n=1 Tax=Punica granatum TaxID=22663 RepID=A0A2I0HW34_PUNGR|nr:hypothetical protein CRG98_043706 [Punica granatum]
MNEQRIPKTTELALWHYSPPSHRSTERAPGARFTDKQTTSQNGLIGTQGPPRSWDKLQTTIRNPTRLPEGRFSRSKRLPTNLRGTFTENRDHSDPRTPQDIRGTLRKPRSQVPRSSRGNGLRSETTSQRSPTRQKGHRNEH